MLPFLTNTSDLTGANQTKLVEVLTGPQKKCLFEVELAAVVDAGKPFVQATYNLEGDGCLAFTCYEIITAAVNMAHYPNVMALARRMHSRR